MLPLQAACGRTGRLRAKVEIIPVHHDEVENVRREMIDFKPVQTSVFFVLFFFQQ